LRCKFCKNASEKSKTIASEAYFAGVFKKNSDDKKLLFRDLIRVVK
jgi:hypothetical protein